MTRSKANEEFRFTQQLTELLRVVADCLRCGDALLELASVQALTLFAKGVETESTCCSPDCVLGVLTEVELAARSHEDAKPSSWLFNHSLMDEAEVLPRIIEAYASEVEELLGFDADQDGDVDAAEMQRYAQMNDGDATNDHDAVADLPAEETKTAEEITQEGMKSPEYVSEFLTTMTKLLVELSLSPISAGAMCRLDAIVLIADVVSVVTDIKHPVLAVSIGCLWNMLEHSNAQLQGGDVALSLTGLLDRRRHTSAQYQMGSQGAIAALCAAFERLLVWGMRESERSLRNQVLIVASLVARRPENRRWFIETGFFSLLLLYSTAAEMGLPTDADQRRFGTTDTDDHEMKTLMWSLIADLCMQCNATVTNEDGQTQVIDYGHECRAIMRQSLFLPTLLLYLDPAQASHPYVSTWSAASRREVELHALSILRLLAPLCPQEFGNNAGPLVALLYFRKHTEGLSVAAEATDSAETDELSGEPDIERQYHALRLVEAVAACSLHGEDEGEGESFCAILGEAGAVEDFVFSLSQADPTQATLTASQILQQTRQRAREEYGVKELPGDDGVTLATAKPSYVTPSMYIEALLSSIAAVVCTRHPDNQRRFRRAGGIRMLLPWLVHRKDDDVHQAYITVAAVAATWAATKLVRKSQAKFVACDGMALLLDLLEASPRYMTNQIVGCIADLVDTPACRPYAKVWRSDRTGTSVVGHLLDLWQAEETRLQVPRESDGAIADPHNPLQGAVSTDTPVTLAANAAAGFADPPAGSRRRKSLANAGKAAKTKADRAQSASEPLSPSDSPSGADSPAFGRLKRALKAAKLWQSVQVNDPDSEIEIAAMDDDLRPKLHAVLDRMSAELDDMMLLADDYEDVNNARRITLALVSKYEHLLLADAWQRVERVLRANGVTPIKPDALLLDQKLEDGFNHAMGLKFIQRQSHSAQEAAVREEEDKFLSTVQQNRQAAEVSDGQATHMRHTMRGKGSHHRSNSLLCGYVFESDTGCGILRRPRPA